VFSIIIVRIGLGIAIDPDTVQGSVSVHIGGGLVNELSTFEASDASNTVDSHFFKNDPKTPKEIGYSDDILRPAKNAQDPVSTV